MRIHSFFLLFIGLVLPSALASAAEEPLLFIGRGDGKKFKAILNDPNSYENSAEDAEEYAEEFAEGNEEEFVDGPGADEDLGIVDYPPPEEEYIEPHFLYLPQVSPQFCESFVQGFIADRKIAQGLEAIKELGGERLTKEKLATCLETAGTQWTELFPLKTPNPKELVSAQEKGLWKLAQKDKPCPGLETQEYYEENGYCSLSSTIPKFMGGEGAPCPKDHVSISGGLYCLIAKDPKKTKIEIQEARTKDEDSGDIITVRYIDVAKNSAPMSVKIPSYFVEEAKSYLRRRLVISYKYYLSSGGEELHSKNFCQSFANSQERNKKFHRHFDLRRFESDDAWHTAMNNGLTEAELTGIFMYTGSHFRYINPAIWSGEAAKDPAHSTFIETTNAGLEKLPAYRERVVRWAALPEKVLAEHKVGNIVTYEAFTSTSSNLEFTWRGGHRFLIYSGAKGKYVDLLSSVGGENEVLFPTGTRFKVLSRSEPNENGQIDFVMAEVDEKGNVIAGPK